MKARAYLFGLNYASDGAARLHGCVNDVRNMERYLTEQHNISCTVATDEDPNGLTGLELLQTLNEAAIASYSEDLDFVWIHYSGHGTYVVDRTGDEADGRDECLVPSDYRTRGVVSDDLINRVFARFNPRTRVVFVFDCCHSGTIGDVRYSWEGERARKLENARCNARARIITISGCLDTQVSMDVRIPNGEAAGAMTSSLLDTLREKPDLVTDAFALVEALRRRLRARGFKQVPKLCSSFDLSQDRALLPATATADTQPRGLCGC